MFRTSRIAFLAAAIGSIAALSGPAAGQSSDDQSATYRTYTRTRDALYDCHVDRANGSLTSSGKRRCNRLSRRYTLYASPAESREFHVHCRTSDCIATPAGEPAADGPYPDDAKIYHWRAGSARHSRHRHHRH